MSSMYFFPLGQCSTCLGKRPNVICDKGYYEMLVRDGAPPCPCSGYSKFDLVMTKITNFFKE